MCLCSKMLRKVVLPMEDNGAPAHRTAVARLLAGTAAFATASVLLVVQSSSAPAELMGRPQPSSSSMQMLYKANPPDKNPFDGFDRGFVQGKYKKVKTVLFSSCSLPC